MYRPFLDANVLWSASYNVNSVLSLLWGLPSVQLLSSSYAVMEAVRNMGSDEQLRDLQRLVQFVEIVPPATSAMPPGVTLAEKDQPILLAAIDGGATHLITGDRHFNKLFGQAVRGVVVLRPRDFLTLVQQP